MLGYSLRFYHTLDFIHNVSIHHFIQYQNFSILELETSINCKCIQGIFWPESQSRFLSRPDSDAITGFPGTCKEGQEG